MNFSRHARLIGAALFALAAIVAVLAWPRAETEPPACSVRDFEGSHFTVCVLDARRDDLRLASHNTAGGYLRSFQELAADLGGDARRVRFAMNAGMFNDQGAPIGLFVADGDQQQRLNRAAGPGNFHMLPNGVFWQGENGAVHVDSTDAFANGAHAVRWATQSGPMLVINGALHPAFQEDGPSRYIRNGVGVSDEHTAYFVISSGAVSFGRFARFFRDELHCRDALFLDGSVSSLWAPEFDRRDGNQNLGPMLVVLSR